MPTNYSPQDDVKPQRRQSFSSITHARPSSTYTSNSANNPMATRLLPTLRKQHPERPLIINLGTLNLSDATTSSDDTPLTATTTATPMSTIGGKYQYRDPPRLPSYYYRPSSYTTSFTPRERPETYVHYTRRPSASSATGGTTPVSALRNSRGGLYMSGSSLGTSSRGSSTSYYQEVNPRGRSSRGYGRGERLMEEEYCRACCKFEVLDEAGLCEECVFFVPNSAGRYVPKESSGRGSLEGREVGGGRRGFAGVRYVDSDKGETDWWARKRAEGLGRYGVRGRRGCYSG